MREIEPTEFLENGEPRSVTTPVNIARDRGSFGLSDVTPAFHPAATRDRLVLSRMSAGEATGGVNPARCFSRPAANASGVA